MKQNSGFSLLEVMVALAISAIVSQVAINVHMSMSNDLNRLKMSERISKSFVSYIEIVQAINAVAPIATSSTLVEANYFSFNRNAEACQGKVHQFPCLADGELGQNCTINSVLGEARDKLVCDIHEISPQIVLTGQFDNNPELQQLILQAQEPNATCISQNTVSPSLLGKLCIVFKTAM